MALDGVTDADAANQESSESYERQELREPRDGALELRRGVAAAADFPAGLGQRCARIISQRLCCLVVGAIVRKPHPVDPAHQTARLQQRGGAQTVDTHQKARPESEAARQLVRLRFNRAADFKGGAANADAIADLEVEPRQQRGISGRTEHAVMIREQIGHRDFRRQRQFAEHRIGLIDSLEFDQRELSVRRARHAAQRRRHRHRSARTQEGDFVRLCLALDQRKRNIAAEQRTAFSRKTVAQTGRHRADTGNRHHAKRDTGDEDIEAAQSAAQLTQRVAQRQDRQPPPACCFHDSGHSAVSTQWRSVAGPSIWPERNRTTRSQRCASEVSCVTSTSVMPRSACFVNRRSTIC